MSVLNWSGVLSPSAAWHVHEEPAENLVLVVRDLRMRYGRTDVLSGVSFGARRGEVLALLRPNGGNGSCTRRTSRPGSSASCSGSTASPWRTWRCGGPAWRTRT